MKLETILLLLGAGLTVYVFLRMRQAQAAQPAPTANGSSPNYSGVTVIAGDGAYDGVSIGRAYLDNLFKLAYQPGANGP